MPVSRPAGNWAVRAARLRGLGSLLLGVVLGLPVMPGSANAGGSATASPAPPLSPAATPLAVTLTQTASSYDATTNTAKIQVTATPSGAAAPWQYTLRRPRDERVVRFEQRRRHLRDADEQLLHHDAERDGHDHRRGRQHGRSRRHPRPQPLPTAAERAPCRRPDPARPHPDADLVRRSPAGGRLARAPRRPADLPGADRRAREPGVRPRDVPGGEQLGHAWLRGDHEELGQHPLLLVGGRLRRRAVQAGQWVHVCQVPQLARQCQGPRPSAGRLRRLLATRRSARRVRTGWARSREAPAT